jgi:hypothetical protein
MPPRWQSAAIAALLEAGPPWLALVRLVGRASEVGERCWSVEILESRGALPRGRRRRRYARFVPAHLAMPAPDPAPGALFVMGGGAARSLSSVLWVEVASPVTSEAEGRAFLEDL